MALGDSITAGTFLRGIQDLTINDITEWRGQSYAAGMDEGAITVPNVSHISQTLLPLTDPFKYSS